MALRLAERLIEWHRHNHRSFAWREQRRTPWEILLSELLLRQTDAKRVASIYDRLIHLAPTAPDLGSLGVGTLEHLLRPLGLYRQRAQGLVQLSAAIIGAGGELPSNEAALRKLPHVGPYAAGAVTVFALGRCAPLPDINVGRVGGRYFGMAFRKRSEIWAVAQRIARNCPRESPREFYWAILDLSAAICKPANPKCAECPLNARCRFGHARLAQLRREAVRRRSG